MRELIIEYLIDEKKLIKQKEKYKKVHEKYKKLYKKRIEEKTEADEEEYLFIMKETRNLRNSRREISNNTILLAKKRNIILKKLNLKCQKQGESRIRRKHEKSKGEKIVEEILIKLLEKKQILYYEYEKKLDVKRIRNLRGDYYILDEKKKEYIIEINGEQHYSNREMLELKKQKELDKLKKEFSIKNNINYLAIRTSIENKLSLESKMKFFFNLG